MDEMFLSGYCRAQDQSRTVTVELEGENWEADCAYPECPFVGNCAIAQRISELQGTA